MRVLKRAGAITAAMLLCAAAARAADFYENKTITIIVGNDAGSGYDSYARVLSRHMGKYIPGKPAIVVQNMPGAGSIKAAQHMYFAAPRDGTSIAILFPGAILEPLTGDAAKYRYDPTKFEFLGTADSGTRLCGLNASAAVQSFEQARHVKSLIAATAAGSSTWDYAYALNALAGSRFEVVPGYKGPAEIFLAMERGEADGFCALDSGTVFTLRPDWLTSQKVRFILQAGMEPNASLLQRGIPSMWDFIAPSERPVAELIVSQQVFGRPFVAPPETPAAQMRLLRDAFLRAFADLEALEEARRMKIDVNPRDGGFVAGLVRKVYASPPDIVARMARAVRP